MFHKQKYISTNIKKIKSTKNKSTHDAEWFISEHLWVWLDLNYVFMTLTLLLIKVD